MLAAKAGAIDALVAVMRAHVGGDAGVLEQARNAMKWICFRNGAWRKQFHHIYRSSCHRVAGGGDEGTYRRSWRVAGSVPCHEADMHWQRCVELRRGLADDEASIAA